MWSKRSGNTVTVGLEGRLDASNTSEISGSLRAAGAFDRDADVVLDCGKLDYISSAGLRVVLSLRKSARSVRMIEVSPEVYEILDITGFAEIIDARRRFRRLSVSGCEVIGRGANGLVYRIDPETAVKVFTGDDSLAEISSERELARAAFIRGIPTAIPYDVVRIEEGGYGSVFELLSAKSLGQLIASGEMSVGEAAKRSAALLRRIHDTEADPAEVPDMKSIAVSWAEGIRPHLAPACAAKLEVLIRSVPDESRFIHGDYHIKNIMLQEGELLLIDMDKLSFGHPVFEFAAIFNAYRGFFAFDREGSEEYLGLPAEKASELWQRTAEAYLGDCDPSAVRALEERASVVGYAHMMNRCIRKNGLQTEYGRREAEFCREKLEAALPNIDSLEFR